MTATCIICARLEPTSFEPVEGQEPYCEKHRELGRSLSEPTWGDRQPGDRFWCWGQTHGIVSEFVPGYGERVLIEPCSRHTAQAWVDALNTKGDTLNLKPILLALDRDDIFAIVENRQKVKDFAPVVAARNKARGLLADKGAGWQDVLCDDTNALARAAHNIGGMEAMEYQTVMVAVEDAVVGVLARAELTDPEYALLVGPVAKVIPSLLEGAVMPAADPLPPLAAPIDRVPAPDEGRPMATVATVSEAQDEEDLLDLETLTTSADDADLLDLGDLPTTTSPDNLNLDDEDDELDRMQAALAAQPAKATPKPVKPAETIKPARRGGMFSASLKRSA